MSTLALAWGSEHRFFLPNEDARPVAAALAAADLPARAPVFVGGSGFVLLEAVARAAVDARPSFVDVAPFQTAYFQEVVRALETAHSAADFRSWFAEELHPRLSAHYRARGQDYPLDAALLAARDLFGLSILFDDARMGAARRAARNTSVFCEEIVSYLSRCDTRHDFIYLSNVPDYLDASALPGLFTACRRHCAPVYALVTSACARPQAVLAAAMDAGFARDPRSCTFDGQNRGLGSRTLDRPWNRPGTIHLLSPRSRPEGAP
jgi:hypothetical protein